ncbi:MULTISPECIES: GNAT family N-acetyltransferase [Pseudomonas]|jgi:putative acetyltransferase|uniref:Acetyltransferase n=2 Tax=Pseudomonas fluorescens TaxID=294 RepID=A0ABY1TLG7_PSEFL|nr:MULTISPECIES: GNAT family N-acetyltransferase [Pseudomonas]MEA3171022.1 putative acetyltransferase [Pseudomonas sp.]MBC8782719.1 GNAT family N-acetyltransferase [Pseudomonas fluorescens]MCI4607483.1 GNAT family N-acetyltransferase [Pseudomonas fluorescens]MDD5443322.1 GNAT family N-acetyltransferase [Pseudomonas fluorescens]NNB67785.1 GNAT family N-acetyltransferase [Pseudomonas fluorescens]
MTIRPRVAADDTVLGALWERSVRATHDFLPEDDIQRLLPLVRDTYLPMPALDVWVFEDSQGLAGFIATGGHNVEMLFIDPDRRGQGIGRQLLEHARARHDTLTVDVNEQNPQAVGFYLHYGFIQVARSPLDGEGKPFPLLHMALPKPSTEGTEQC